MGWMRGGVSRRVATSAALVGLAARRAGGAWTCVRAWGVEARRAASVSASASRRRKRKNERKKKGRQGEKNKNILINFLKIRSESVKSKMTAQFYKCSKFMDFYANWPLFLTNYLYLIFAKV